MFITIHRLYCDNPICDGDPCFNADEQDFASAGKIWEAARKCGWQKRKKPNGKMGHYCPFCIPPDQAKK